MIMLFEASAVSGAERRQNWLISRPSSATRSNSAMPASVSFILMIRFGKTASIVWKGPEMAMSWIEGRVVFR